MWGQRSASRCSPPWPRTAPRLKSTPARRLPRRSRTASSSSSGWVRSSASSVPWPPWSCSDRSESTRSRPQGRRPRAPSGHQAAPLWSGGRGRLALRLLALLLLGRRGGPVLLVLLALASLDPRGAVRRSAGAVERDGRTSGSGAEQPGDLADEPRHEGDIDGAGLRDDQRQKADGAGAGGHESIAGIDHWRERFAENAGEARDVAHRAALGQRHDLSGTLGPDGQAAEVEAGWRRRGFRRSDGGRNRKRDGSDSDNGEHANCARQLELL